MKRRIYGSLSPGTVTGLLALGAGWQATGAFRGAAALDVLLTGDHGQRLSPPGQNLAAIK